MPKYLTMAAAAAVILALLAFPVYVQHTCRANYKTAVNNLKNTYDEFEDEFYEPKVRYSRAYARMLEKDYPDFSLVSTPSLYSENIRTSGDWSFQGGFSPFDTFNAETCPADLKKMRAVIRIDVSKMEKGNDNLIKKLTRWTVTKTYALTENLRWYEVPN